MKLASIEIVNQVHSHPNADRLELATVLGWQIIVGKGEFKPGDRAVLVIIDSLVPRTSWSEFLFKDSGPDASKFRLRTIKLRGQYSQGLLLPMSVLDGNCEQGWEVGADVSGALGITKHEKEVPTQLRGIIRGGFPIHRAPKTDEDNALSDPVLVKEVLRHRCHITLKLDGTSFTTIFENGVLIHVCSRSADRQESDTDVYWRIARRFALHEGLCGFVQGEIMGPGINGNQLELLEPELYIYQVALGNSHVPEEWLSYQDMVDFARATGDEKIHVVPSLGFVDPGVSMAYLQALADSTTLPNGEPAEGIVVRPVVPHVYRGRGRPLGFKVMNRPYDAAKNRK